MDLTDDDRVLLEPHSPATQHYGRAAVILVVFLGLGVAWLGTREPWSFYAAGALIGLVYTLLSIGFGEERWTTSSQSLTWGYFVIQIALTSLLALLFARHGIFSMQWLACMPLIAQGHIYLPTWGAILVALLSLVIIGVHVYSLGGWQQALGSVLSVSTAMIFVLLFTDIAQRESAARVESQRLGAELLAANRQLVESAVEAEELAVERERSRLAREIHDSLGHYLTVVHVQLEAAKTMLERDPEKTRGALDKAQDLTQQGLEEIRRSVASLRPAPLEGRTLEESLSELVARSQQSGLVTQLQVLGTARNLGARADLALYRTVQEGLTNARKHSRAERVEVALDYRNRDTVRLEIRDDGVGSENPSGGFGLLGARERMRQLAGRLEIRTAPGDGLSLEVEIPA